jgi:hypothetical protein
MELRKSKPVDWSNLPPLWRRDVSEDHKPGSSDSGTLVFKHPNGVKLLSIAYSDEVFACIFTPHQAHAIMMAVAGLFEDCKPAEGGDHEQHD